MTKDEFAPVVMVTPTICDGQVVRWYVNKHTADRGFEVVSASRNGICVGGQSPRAEQIDGLIALIRFAQSVSDAMAQGVDQSHLATHERPGVFGLLQPVAS